MKLVTPQRPLNERSLQISPAPGVVFCSGATQLRGSALREHACLDTVEVWCHSANSVTGPFCTGGLGLIDFEEGIIALHSALLGQTDNLTREAMTYIALLVGAFCLREIEADFLLSDDV